MLLKAEFILASDGLPSAASLFNIECSACRAARGMADVSQEAVGAGGSLLDAPLPIGFK